MYIRKPILKLNYWRQNMDFKDSHFGSNCVRKSTATGISLNTMMIKKKNIQKKEYGGEAPPNPPLCVNPESIDLIEEKEKPKSQSGKQAQKQAVKQLINQQAAEIIDYLNEKPPGTFPQKERIVNHPMITLTRNVSWRCRAAGSSKRSRTIPMRHRRHSRQEDRRLNMPIRKSIRCKGYPCYENLSCLRFQNKKFFRGFRGTVFQKSPPVFYQAFRMGRLNVSL
jgi:hypothetical protein